MYKKILFFITLFLVFLLTCSYALADEYGNVSYYDAEGRISTYDTHTYQTMVIEDGVRYVADKTDYSNCVGPGCAYSTYNYEIGNYRPYVDYSGYVSVPTSVTSYVCTTGGDGEKQCVAQTLPAGSYKVSEIDCLKNCLPSIGGVVFIDEDADGVQDSTEIGYAGEALGTYEKCEFLTATNCSANSCEYGEQCITDNFCCFLGTIPLSSVLDSSGNIKECTSCWFPIPSWCAQKSICCSPDYSGLTITVTNNSTGQEYVLTSSTVIYSELIWGGHNIEGGNFNTYEVSPDGIPDGDYTVALTLPDGYYNTTANPRTVTVVNSNVNIDFGITTTLPTSTTTTSSTTTSITTSSTTTTTTTVPPESLITSWIQTTGADLRIEGSGDFGEIESYNYNVPDPSTTTCGIDPTYASLAGAGGYPGIIFAGTSSYSFCSDPGGCPERSSTTGWVVGGSVYPERYAPVDSGGRLKTSYDYVSSRVLEAGITPVVITELTSGLANGVYRVSGNLDVPSGTYTFTADRDYLFLIEGNLNINGNIKVPVGSTATFVVNGNITVDEGVGQLDYNSTTTNIEGLYSAGGSFVLNGTGDCATERRLNMAGSLVINAGLSGGTFQNERDLCEGNSTCPVFSITERPDFILNAPELIKYSNYIWQEVAP